jgi:hypothetical protein
MTLGGIAKILSSEKGKAMNDAHESFVFVLIRGGLPADRKVRNRYAL